MNDKILHTEVQNFIIKNQGIDIMSVLLKKPFFAGISNTELAQQLEARKRCEKKLPLWYNTPKIYYPRKLNIEQTSSEATARYKSEIVARTLSNMEGNTSKIGSGTIPEVVAGTKSEFVTGTESEFVTETKSEAMRGKSLLDATGGLGVDSYFFSKKFERVFHCEIDDDLSRIAAHNFKVLGAENVETVRMDGTEFIGNFASRFDCIYLDPSRRNDVEGKVFRLSDCQPDVTRNLELLFAKSDNILLKTSPLLDFSIGIQQLEGVKEIHVVALNNEVKELLWMLKRGYSGEITVKTVNISKKGHKTLDFPLSAEKNTASLYSEPLSYLYEPNAAIMKSGAFKTVAKRFQLKKLHEHTHLYTSDTLIDFPGRRFKVDSFFPYNKKHIKRLGLEKANISTRNFPESVAELRKTLRIDDGGDRYLFFVTVGKDIRTIILAQKAEGVL